MGLLDNGSNIITVDAVLTDAGRAALSRNDGSFEIVSYAFADDEINYGLFQPNTGSLQQDNNILNTPCLEANANERLALKYQLMSISNPDLNYLPVLACNVTSLSLGERTDSQVGKSIGFSQNTQAGRTVPSEIIDASFLIQMNNDLLYMASATPTNITPYGTAQYVVPRSAINNYQGATVNVQVAVQSLPNDLWASLGSGVIGNRSITTSVRCQGVLSGLLTDVTIQINEEYIRNN